VLSSLFLSHLAIELIFILRLFLNNKYSIHFGNGFLLPYITWSYDDFCARMSRFLDLNQFV